MAIGTAATYAARLVTLIYTTFKCYARNHLAIKEISRYQDTMELNRLYKHAFPDVYGTCEHTPHLPLTPLTHSHTHTTHTSTPKYTPTRQHTTETQTYNNTQNNTENFTSGTFWLNSVLFLLTVVFALVASTWVSAKDCVRPNKL